MKMGIEILPQEYIVFPKALKAAPVVTRVPTSPEVIASELFSSLVPGVDSGYSGLICIANVLCRETVPLNDFFHMI